MKGCMKAEVYKLLYNKFLYFNICLVLFVSIVCYCAIEEENRLNDWIYYFSFLFLFIVNFVVGSIISDEYSSTLKDMIISVKNRRIIFITKVLSCILAIHIIFIIYFCAMFLSNNHIEFYIVVNQYIAVMQHTIGLIGIAIFIKSFSALSIVTVILLCIYREMSMLQGTGFMEIILKSTYSSQFSNINSVLSFNYVFLFIIVFSLGAGYYFFKNQDIR
ncbi:MAG: hypothetical protein NC412_06570 [Roseburia sp.]|nr:hypothetical protein [Roseburia sp.]MCM1278800.1 hypothetical protein [Robinsoniella sp.]